MLRSLLLVQMLPTPHLILHLFLHLSVLLPESARPRRWRQQLLQPAKNSTQANMSIILKLNACE
jgi:hypothetical protein